MTRRCEEAHLREIAGDNRVQSCGAGKVKDRSACDIDRSRALEDSRLARLRSRWDLGKTDISVMIDRDNVGESSANVDADGRNVAYAHRNRSSSNSTQPSRFHGSRDMDARQVWHFTTMNHPPSASTGYFMRFCAPHSSHAPKTGWRSTAAKVSCVMCLHHSYRDRSTDKAPVRRRRFRASGNVGPST